MRGTQQPVFLARQTYRMRRVVDAARVLPAVGLMLFLLPLLWAEPSLAAVGLYVFAVWLLLIVAALAMSRRLARLTGGEGEPPEGPEP
ncbi:hypothetical protein [Haematobacter genomosp. 1]|uniref:Uncharacterized protein n=1 Tax=Haematobacter genomosp. 1 TaxID=366618 RepID=A0A212AF16_9RHOB|nr:hypothetical protein [Haematobacter genomosp. 1]OWJ79933.1 hypothetical protein CDV49_03900 [Haematobacter genomosp. 1]